MSVLKLALRRLLVSIPLLLAITAATFFLVFNSPGNYADFLKSDKRFTQQQIEQDIKKLGLDKPWYMLWGRYVTGVVTRGDLGKSFVERDRPVARIASAIVVIAFKDGNAVRCQQVNYRVPAVCTGQLGATRVGSDPDTLASSQRD